MTLVRADKRGSSNDLVPNWDREPRSYIEFEFALEMSVEDRWR
jgi:hypothetical protein